MAKFKNDYEIVSQFEISDGIFDMLVDCEQIAKEAKAGQFVNVFVGDGARLLPRPISICEIVDARFLRLVYRVTGENSGTKKISKLAKKNNVTLLGPLGNGFLTEPVLSSIFSFGLDEKCKREDGSDNQKKSENHFGSDLGKGSRETYITDFNRNLNGANETGCNILLIGGGIGIPPMLELGKQLRKRLQYSYEGVLRTDFDLGESDRKGTYLPNERKSVLLNTKEPERLCGANVSALLGYRDSQTFLLDDFKKLLPTVITTDDGGLGFHGTTVDYLKQQKDLPDVVMACGPTPMLRALKELCEARQILCYLSLEERMACGIGACLACMVNTNEINLNMNISNKRICKEGPVFLSTEILL